MASSLTRFNPNQDLPSDFMLLMYGMRRCGKTTSLMFMLEQMKERFKQHQVHVFSGTAHENPAQWKHFPPGSVTADISNIDALLGDILNEQQEQIREEVKRQMSRKPSLVSKRKRSDAASGVKKGKLDSTHPLGTFGDVQNDTSAYAEEGVGVNASNSMHELTDSEILELRRQGKVDESRFPRRLIILDDVVNESSIRFSPNLNKLAVSGRHIFITCIILSQCVCGSGSVPPIIRRNSDYIMVVGYPRSTHERRLLAVDYLTISNTKGAADQALRLLSDITKVKYRIFVIDVTNSTATQYNHYLYQYGPVPAPPDNVSAAFKLGTAEQWNFKLHSGNRDPKYTEEDAPKKPTHEKTAGRFKNKVQPMFRSTAASEQNPYAVREYFNPIF